MVSNSGGVLDTTSNRMELQAVLEGLVYAVLHSDQPLKDVIFNVYSDSAYVVNAVAQGWLQRWANDDWQSHSGDVANQEYWRPLYYVLKLLPDVKFIHVKGHTGVELNELCDELAGEEASRMQREFETPDQMRRRMQMNQITRTHRRPTFTRRPMLVRRRKEEADA